MSLNYYYISEPIGIENTMLCNYGVFMDIINAILTTGVRKKI